MRGVPRSHGAQLFHVDTWRGVFWLSFLAVILAGGAGCEKEQPPPPPQAIPVTAAEVLVRDQTVYSEYVGQTRGSAEVEIRARVDGVLESIHFQEGALVKTGNLLYTIDPKPYEALLAKAQGELARAEAALAKARQDVVRFEPLIKRNAISRQQYDEAIATERANAAAVESAQAALESAQLQLGYTRITAPVEGRIGKSEVQVGDLVGQGQNTLLTTISTIDPIHVRFSVSEREHLEWRRAYPNEEKSREVTRNVFELVLADGSNYPYKGSVVFADRTVDPTTGTLLIEVTFPNPNYLLRPGQYARVLFPRVITNAVLVPQRSVRELQATYTVFVVTPELRAAPRPVKPGPRTGSLWVIESGLKPGERIVIDGVQKVQPGALLKPVWVKIEDPPPEETKKE